MEQEAENSPRKEDEIMDENAIILKEENTPALYDNTAEAFEADIEIIDLTEDAEA
ncbi:hypothetical protein [Adhaeribacter rhizoryzae]|uniref:hypothetical protein n=1 Tax=Adhaeribacter rhizoryzae TaxID=2607907 RepID=UPI00167FDF99|nr:hypothetical protein [Adhaeribacter rhizoryzae]